MQKYADHNNTLIIPSWLKNSVSLSGMLEKTKILSKAILLLTFSVASALLFWHIRAWIPTVVDYSYKNYVIWLDSAITGTVPSLWIQENFRIEFLDKFFRWVWLSYSFVLLFGSTFAFCIKADVKRHFLTVLLTLSAGLLIHYLLPTQPPWMAVEQVIRINGDYFTKVDKNLTAAMPSIHQAIIAVAGCMLWRYGTWGKTTAIGYNLIMMMALVYLGEHFVIDSIAGIVIAIQSWKLAGKIMNGSSRLKILGLIKGVF
jgi:membrane-associated phospholipid phosphatase